MRRLPLIAAILVLLVSRSAFAQEWIEYASQRDFFSINFPRQPDVRDITYKSQFGLELPARVYSATVGPNRYSVTAVDYNVVSKMHAEKSKACQANETYPDVCNDSTTNELRGAMDFAVWGFIQRDAKITFYTYYSAELVEGKQLQLTNPDGSRTFAAINIHDNRLYIAEGTVPKGAPLPALFQQSMGFIDKEGKRIRYETIYSNAYPPPRRSR
jgi:hypothetical protein